MNFVPGPEGCECIDNYQPDGFHPVTVGDVFDEGRYTILHKLGAGGYATVWLARDNESQLNVALKICMAGSSQYTNEVKIYEHLEDKAEESGKRSYSARLLDAFWHQGPNGSHRIIVTEIGGPSLASIRDRMKIRPDTVRELAEQLLKGLQELHSAGVVYGDFTPANILIRPESIDRLSEEELYERFGQPVPIEVEVMDEDAMLDEHVPKYVYEAIDTSKMRTDLIEEPEVMLIDFGEAYIVDDEEKSELFGYNYSYASPETIVMEDRATQASDIWALACIIYEMRSGEQLFTDGMMDQGVIRSEMIDVIGHMPPKYLQKVLGPRYQPSKAVEAQDKSATPIPPPSLSSPNLGDTVKGAWNWILSVFKPSHADTCTPADDYILGKPLAARIEHVGRWNKWCTMTRQQRIATYKKYLRAAGKRSATVPEEVLDMGGPPPAELSPLEKEDFENLLSSMLKWLPEDRPTLEELEKHPYFHRMYMATTEMSGPWLQKFHWGLKLSVHRNGKVNRIC